MQNASYLESKILTATPQRLHLLLIEGAIRFGRQAEEALRRGDELAAAMPLVRVLDILGELLVGVRKNKSDLTLKIADLYLFLFRQISKAKINADVAALAEALRLLEFERQTWQLLCDKLGSDPSTAKPAAAHLRTLDSTAPRGTRPGVSWQA